ncbi:holo-ACP synthase [Streptomyces muensis]|uniref:Holo-[acyl-carrier-protein] synthase n=1 Tax=Streptomyces muensis TaxID=1077944 RepID=A0A9X1PYY4_STRM4|nr:holo-ACP synthase [Streptomyces muensis]MCF1595942.1 holo-ACP synthase [Streptomyces muensis]
MNTAAGQAARIGLDVLDCSELRRLVERPWFLRFAFAPEELAHAETLGAHRLLEFLAGRFAAKEAVFKVLGIGFLQGVAPREICVEHTSHGAPIVHLRGRAAQLTPTFVSVSITHKQNVVAAVAIGFPWDAGAQAENGRNKSKEPDAVSPPNTNTTATVQHNAREERAPETSETSQSSQTSESATTETTAFLRVRIGQEEAHYGGDLVDGARILRLFGDLVTEITIRTDGDEGLLSQYTDLRFTAPVKPGDYIEARGRLVRRTRLRRVVELQAHKVLSARPGAGESVAAVLDAPQLVCTATATTVVPHRRTDPQTSLNPTAEET